MRSRFIKASNGQSDSLQIASIIGLPSKKPLLSTKHKYHNIILPSNYKHLLNYVLIQMMISKQLTMADNMKSSNHFDHEYWMKYLDFDNDTVRMCYQGNADYLTDFNIHPKDVQRISTMKRSKENYTLFLLKQSSEPLSTPLKIKSFLHHLSYASSTSPLIRSCTLEEERSSMLLI